MIIEPVPTNPRSPVRRFMRVVGITLPVLLLGAVVAAGVLGPRPAPPEPAPSGPVATAAGSLLPQVVAPDVLDARIPPVEADLRVLTIAAAQARLAAADQEPIAVAGTLGDVAAVTDCRAAAGDTRGSLGPLCERSARLIDGPATAGGLHIHLHIPAGVRLPGPFEVPGTTAAMPVVLIGRSVGPDAPCVTSQRGCGEQLVLDRVAWLDGAAWDPGPVFDAGLEVAPPAIALRGLDSAQTLATGWSGTILVSALIRPSTLVAVDPVAAQDVPAGPPPEDLVWYVRGLETAYDATHFPLGHAPPRLSWAVIDYATGRTLSHGAEAASGELPAAVAGLRVRDIADAVAAWRASPSSRVVAVAGYLRAWADPQACADPIAGLPGDGCPRSAILAVAPWSERDGATDAVIGEHVTGRVPPGVTVPESAIGLPVVRLRAPPQVVVIGRFGATDAGCGASLVGCVEPFTIEAVAWADGQPIATGRQVAAGLLGGDSVLGGPVRQDDGPLGGTTRLLRVVLARRGALVQLDATAAAALRSTTTSGAQDPVWYVRGYNLDTGLIRYAVVDPATGAVLVWGGGTS